VILCVMRDPASSRQIPEGSFLKALRVRTCGPPLLPKMGGEGGVRARSPRALAIGYILSALRACLGRGFRDQPHPQQESRNSVMLSVSGAPCFGQ
jgi:hypothetical protein